MTVKGGTSHACAACKYQRRKCSANCSLAPYFPPDRPEMFQNAHKLFGVSNILKIIKTLPPQDKNEAMKTIIYESECRAAYPVHGIQTVIFECHYKLQQARMELQFVNSQLATYRQQQQQQNQQISHPPPPLLQPSPSSQLQLGTTNTNNTDSPNNNTLSLFQHQTHQPFDDATPISISLTPHRSFSDGSNAAYNTTPQDYYIESKDNMVKATQDYYIESKDNMQEKATQDYYIESKDNMQEKATQDYYIESKDNMQEKATQDYYIDSKDNMQKATQDYYIDSKDNMQKATQDYYIESKDDMVKAAQDYYIESKDNMGKATQDYYIDSKENNAINPLWMQHAYNDDFNINNNNDHNAVAVQSQMFADQEVPFQQQAEEATPDYEEMPVFFDAIDDRQSYIDSKEAYESSSESSLRDTTQSIEHVNSENELKSAAACFSLTSVN